MPFKKGQPHMGHVLTEEEKARARATAQANREKRKALRLEDLKEKSGTTLSLVMEHLLEVNPETGEERMTQLLRESSLKEIAVVFGIMTEKFLLTQGQPTTIVSHQERIHGDKLLDALQEEWSKRKALSHRPISIDAVK